MPMRRTTVLTALFVFVAVGLFLVWKGLEAPRTPPHTAIDVAHAEQTADAAAAHTTAEPQSALEVSDDTLRAAADGRSDAAPDRDAARTENFALDDARWIEGSVRVPAGTPTDEVLDVWMLPTTVQPAAGARVVQSLDDAQLLIELARANDAKNEWAVRPVGADRTFRVPYPNGAQSVNLVLAGRYLYLTEPVPVSLREHLAPVVLEPELGGWLVARCTVTAGDDSQETLAGVPSTLSGFKLDARAMRRGRGMTQRTAEIAVDRSIEYRALPPDLRYSLIVTPKTFAVATSDEFQIKAGTKTEITIALELGARIAGRVRDDHGTPVAGAAIESEERRFNMSPTFGNAQRKAESQADGTFEILGLRAGKTHLTARRDGYVDGKSDEIALTTGETRTGIEIALSTGNKISGRVTWPDGLPAIDATVSAREAAPAPTPQRGPRGMRPRRAGLGEIDSAKTDAKGEFTLTGLGDGPLTVQAGAKKASATGAAEPLWTATLEDVAVGASALAFVLREPHGLKGRVVDDTGAAVAEFTVSATPTFGSDGPIIDRSARSHEFKSADGTFLLEGLQDGKFSVTVQSDGYMQTGTVPSITIPQDETDFQILLVRTGSAAGRVIDPSGRPVVGATVSSTTPGANGPFNFGGDDASAESDAQGEFVLASVPAGSIALSASADAWAKSEPLDVQIVPRQRTEGLVITLRAGGRLTGEIYNSRGEPGAGRSIQMFSMDAGDMRSLRADGSGRFEADHLTPGTYQIVAEPAKSEREDLERRIGDDADPTELMSAMKMTSATIQDGVETHVVMGAPPKAPVKLSGTITRAGEPTAAGRVTVLGEGGAMLASLKMGKVDSAGHYELTLDKPGDIVLVVSKGADPGGGIEFYETIPEVAEYRLDLALPLGAIQGRVRGPDGRPLAATRVQLTSDSGFTSLSMMAGGGPTSVETDASGRFEFVDLHPGTFAVAAGGSMGRAFLGEDSPHGRSVRGGLKVEANKVLDGVELVLSTPSKVTGRVLDASGQPTAGATVYLRDEQGELLHRFSTCSSDSAGRFTYEGVSPGKYTACARTKTLASRESGSVSVHEGEAAEVDIVLEPGTWLRISLEDKEQKSLRAQISVKNDRDHEVGNMLGFDSIQSMFSEGISSSERKVGPLPAGKYTVIATAADGKTTKKSVTLKGQDERKLVLRLD